MLGLSSMGSPWEGGRTLIIDLHMGKCPAFLPHLSDVFTRVPVAEAVRGDLLESGLTPSS